MEAQVELLRATLTDGADRMVFLTGGDYPLWSKQRISDYFAKAGDSEIISGIAMPGQGRAAYPYTDFRPLAGKSWRMLSVKGQMRSGLKRMLNGLHIHKTARIYCPEDLYIVQGCFLVGHHTRTGGSLSRHGTTTRDL